MKAIVIENYNRDFIGLATNYSWAIDFLIKENLLDENYLVRGNRCCFLLKEIFPNWQEEIKSWDIEKFNKFFFDDFYFEVVEVYGG